MDKHVQIVGDIKDRSIYYKAVVDEKTGKFKIPLNPYKKSLKEVKDFLIARDGSLENAAKICPISVIIDTGVIHDHPLIKES